MALVVKNLPASAGDISDTGSFLGQEDPLEKGMATHSSILTWRIPWTEEPGGLQSMRSQKPSDTTGQLTLSALFATNRKPHNNVRLRSMT